MAIKHIGANSRGSDMTESQDDKYLTHNDHIDLLADRFLQKAILAIGFSSGNDYNLSAEDWTENFTFELLSDTSPSIDQDFNLFLPEGLQGQAFIQNNTGFLATVAIDASPTGRSVQVNDGAFAHIYSDGANVDEAKRDTFDIIAFTNDVTEGGIIGAVLPPRNLRLPAGLPGSSGYAFTILAADEDDVELSIQKDEVEQGTMTWSALDADAVISFTSDVDFAPGERLRLIWNSFQSPSTAMSMADVAVTIKAVAP